MLLALAVLLCSSSAFCQMNNTSGELNASALQSLIADASIPSESYRFLMDMEQNTNIANLTSGEAQELYTHTIGFGSLNMTSRALKLVMASLTLPRGDDENATASALEEYLLNDTVYLKVDGNWTSMKLPVISESWSQQNTIGQQIDMLNRSNLSLLGSEVVDGQECYKLKAEMGSLAIAEQMSQQAASILPAQSMNLTQLFRNMSIEALYWITKDAHQLKKAEVLQSFIMNPESLGLPINETGNLSMSVNTTISMVFQDMNKSVNVQLPSEAGNATPFLQSLLVSGKMDSSALGGNATNVTMTNNETRTAGLT